MKKENVKEKMNPIRTSILILLSPLLAFVFLMGFGLIVLAYSLLFCFYVFSFCLFLIGIIYGLHFFVSLFNYIPFAIFEMGIVLTAFALSSILFHFLGIFISFLNKLIHLCFDRFIHLIKGGTYEKQKY